MKIAESKKNILILGAGFGGISAVLNLYRGLKNKNDFNVILIDKNNYHLFAPSIYEVATAYSFKEDKFNQYLRASVTIPIAEIIGEKRINFIQAEIKEINIKEKYIKISGDKKINFDYLVYALGGTSEFFGIPGVREYAFNFKSLDDAIAIYKKIQFLYNNYAKNKDKNYYIKIAIIGGGFTGIELSAELSCCIKNITKLCGLNHKCTDIQIFEAAPKILSAINDKQRNVILKRLNRLRIKINTNCPVQEVGPNFIKAKNKEKEYFDLIIWAGGIRGLDLVKNIGLLLDKRNRIIVNNFFQVINQDNSINKNIFAIGDSVNFLDPKTKKPVPAMAFIAANQGKVASRNILNIINNKKLKSYKPFYDVWITPVGGKWAYFHYKKINIYGFVGWLLRELVDLRYFLSCLPVYKALKFFFKEVVIFTKND